MTRPPTQTGIGIPPDAESEFPANAARALTRQTAADGTILPFVHWGPYPADEVTV
jgi:hypothetical protein